MQLNKILFREMPDTIKVDGVEYQLYTDFRTWLKAGHILSKLNEKNGEEILFELCDLVVFKYPDEGFALGDSFIQGILDFYKGYPKTDNELNEKKKEKEKQKPKPPDFDFYFDIEYIYCSFMSFYGIRLETVEFMHWWEFLILFEGLMMSDQTSMNFVVGTRQRKINPKMSKEEKALLEKQKRQFALPQDEETKEAQNKLTDILGKKLQSNKTE